MVVLISGATGFIGSALVRAFETAGHTVVGLTRQRVTPPSSTCRLISVDLTDVQAASLLGELIKPDVIVHAAAVMSNRTAAVGGDYSSNDPITRNLLNAFELCPPLQIVYMGSIDVYATSLSALNENSVVAPATPYAESKLAAEVTCRRWSQAFDVQLRIARLTQIFGPGDPTAKFIPSALAALKAGRPISLFGDGEDQRDYLYVDDAARLVTRWVSVEGGQDCLNLASGTSYSLNAMLEQMRSVIPAPIVVQHLPRKKPRQDLKFDTAAMQRTLGPYKPTPIAEALRCTYDSLV